MHKMNLILFVSCIICGFSGQVSADAYFCVGENKEVCGIEPTYDCGTDAEAVAQAVCTSNNQKQRYKLNLLYVTDGNKCGYHVWEAECIANDQSTLSTLKALKSFKIAK